MIKAVANRIIIEIMKATKTQGGLILPSSSSEPQSYGRVLSIGETVENIKVGDIIVFPPRAGMDVLINKKLMKVVVYEEIYGTLDDVDVIATLEVVDFGNNENKL